MIQENLQTKSKNFLFLNQKKKKIHLLIYGQNPFINFFFLGLNYISQLN